MEITKIVITGGPCGGKSKSLGRIKEVFSARGYTVLTIAETATELIRGGIAPWTCGTSADFQRMLFLLQIEKEKCYEAAARTMPQEKFLIVCDRGTFDGIAYVPKTVLTETLSSLGKTEREVLCSYGAVFHLTTAAKGAEAHYTTANNAARTETPAEAAELDDRVLTAWSEHPYRRVIDNSTDFEGKLARLVREIELFLDRKREKK